MQLLLVGDGPRDEAVIPALVKTAVPVARKGAFRAWKAIPLTQGGGYERRLRLAIRISRDQELAGVVATVDVDRARRGERLQSLRTERDSQWNSLSATPTKIALGEADPHVEAWLLDDPKAIRDTLGLHTSTDVPNVARCSNPKDAIQSLMEQSARNENAMKLLGEIAMAVVADRCNHRSDTGLEAFLDDVREELR